MVQKKGKKLLKYILLLLFYLTLALTLVDRPGLRNVAMLLWEPPVELTAGAPPCFGLVIDCISPPNSM